MNGSWRGYSTPCAPVAMTVAAGLLAPWAVPSAAAAPAARSVSGPQADLSSTAADAEQITYTLTFSVSAGTVFAGGLEIEDVTDLASGTSGTAVGGSLSNGGATLTMSVPINVSTGELEFKGRWQGGI